MPVVGILFIIGLALFVAAAAFTVERLVPAKRREVHNEVVGFVYAVVGVTYAVLLGLVVISAWNNLDQTKANTYTECNALIWLDWYAYSLPQPQHAEVEVLLKQYTVVVISTEWPEMAHHQPSPEAWSVYQQLHKLIQAQQPTTPAAVARYQVAVNDKLPFQRAQGRPRGIPAGPGPNGAAALNAAAIPQGIRLRPAMMFRIIRSGPLYG